MFFLDRMYQHGAISNNGTSTNALSCILGCGRIKLEGIYLTDFQDLNRASINKLSCLVGWIGQQLTNPGLMFFHPPFPRDLPNFFQECS